MNGTELITFLVANAPAISPVIGPIVGSVITAVFLRSNTATTEFEKIKAGKFDEAVEDLLVSGQMTYTEFYKAKNFLSIAKKADSYYSQNKKVEEDKIYDFDWFLRYYEAAGNINDDDMQEIWAKVLAGEVSNPSYFSLRTIDVLRNMRKTDAELFVKICECSFNRGDGAMFLPNYESFLDAYEITYSDIMRLSEMGLIFNDATITINFDIPQDPAIIFVNRNLIMTISSKQEMVRRASIKQYPFTRVGQELASLISESPSDEQFVEFGRIISESNDFNVSIHKVIQFTENKIRYDRTNILEGLAENKIDN